MSRPFKQTAYSIKLKDPRWQKMRLKILERDEFTCQNCGGTEKCLHVHHKYYLPRKEPWEYPENSLITLCETCHEIETEQLGVLCSDLITMLKQRGFMAKDINELCTLVVHGKLDCLMGQDRG